MIYFRFLRSHPDVNPAKKDSPELKLANRHSESIDHKYKQVHFKLGFYSKSKKSELNFYSIFA